MQYRFLAQNIRLLTRRLLVALLMCSLLVTPVSVYAEATAGAETVADGAAAGPTATPPPVRDPLTNHLTNWPQMTEINEDSAVLMDADNGAILYSLDRDVQRIPASITKIMTCLLVIENVQMDEVVTMTEAGMAEAYGGSSNINPVLGEQFTVEQCLYMLMLKSANDIAAQLAEYVGGSVEAFVQMMNDRCAKIGTTGTHFNNPNGLPGDDHYTTAMDMALIMQECLKNDTFRQIISTQTYTVPPTNMTATERTYDNHCKLIIESSEHYYPYCIGGKTGYTDLAWRTLITAAEKDGRTLICVTLHGPDNRDFTDHKSLFEYGFNSFRTDPCEGEASEGWELSGGVTIPNGMEVSALTRQETTLGDGNVRIDYKYEDNPVGSVVKIKTKSDASLSKAETVTSTESSIQSSENMSDAVETDVTAQKAEKEEKGNHLLPILLIILIVLIAALAVVIRMLYVSHQKELEREEQLRKKRAARKRKSGSKKRSGRVRDRTMSQRTTSGQKRRPKRKRPSDDFR